MALLSASGRSRLLTTSFLAATAVLAACGDGTKEPAGPQLPGPGGPASALKPVAFIADVNLRTGVVRITPPSSATIDGADLGLAADALGLPDLSLLGGEAVRLIPSNFLASAVGAHIPGKIRVTFDVIIENKLPGINFITPTWPTPPAPGVILVPLEQIVTTTPGGATGGDGNEIIVELPSYGQVVPSIDWNGTGVSGSGSPFSFFNDADCGLATSNDCFRWEAYGSPVFAAPATSEARSIGFDIDPTVGQFRARMILAADLAPAAPVTPATVSGSITSPARGPLEGVVVNVQGGFSDARMQRAPTRSAAWHPGRARSHWRRCPAVHGACGTLARSRSRWLLHRELLGGLHRSARHDQWRGPSEQRQLRTRWCDRCGQRRRFGCHRRGRRVLDRRRRCRVRHALRIRCPRGVLGHLGAVHPREWGQYHRKFHAHLPAAPQPGYQYRARGGLRQESRSISIDMPPSTAPTSRTSSRATPVIR